ncbi:type III-B CRISPR module RAMP protein Cmr6 [Emticicia agri]|uniref:Type III-B CRISPR module RAMP protein Cmr6 n=1 Tax=Emticicia agri TaxID=2492393 RepID=A0A4Q5LUD2_9BACT|nr:type III-B CRISPR module RAMP protein Cmr6 [Emticicia agri]RYU93043.1 type III-B CRISPR module RAMP protein Cmr6 [Emticicia agri]
MNEKEVNLGFLFNKEYYKHNGETSFNFADRGNATYSQGFFKKQNERFKRFIFTGTKTPKGVLDLTTVYPGLAIGLGYGHGIKAEGEFKLGFYFDYTSGLPVIPGSSVKGTLRSCFPNIKPDHKEKYNTDELEKTEAKRGFIRYLFYKAGLSDEQVLQIDIDVLEKEIFEGKSIDKDKKDIQLSIYTRDIFHDATLVQGNSLREIIGDDSITPHPSALKNPIPLLFMKILPNVTFHFEMDIKDSKRYPFVTKAIKQKVFMEIIRTIGIGAKTNVGYGRMVSNTK